MMIVSFDMGADYDVTSKEYVTCGLYGLGGGPKDEIQPLAFYLCFVLVGTDLRFIYIHGSILYLFP